MKVIESGHIYQLQHTDGAGAGVLVFVNRESGTEHEGTQTQDVLRALIDRTLHCDKCLRWDGNDKIVHHLRMALSLHEARALERKTEKGELQSEKVQVHSDGHFALNSDQFIAGRGVHRWQMERVTMASPRSEPTTTDYCVTCGNSPESAIHLIGRDSHPYVDPRGRR